MKRALGVAGWVICEGLAALFLTVGVLFAVHGEWRVVALSVGNVVLWGHLPFFVRAVNRDDY